MYISKIKIENYRNFSDITVHFREGLNVLVGENNIGKTNLIRALRLFFDHDSPDVRRIGSQDFNDKCLRAYIHEVSEGKGDSPPDVPSIKVAVTLKSSSPGQNIDDDYALVATWLTSLDENTSLNNWEAELTYCSYLAEEYKQEFTKALKEGIRLKTAGDEEPPEDAPIDKARRVIDAYVERGRFVWRIFAGRFENRSKVEPEYLQGIRLELLDALRDAETKLLSGRQPLLREVLGRAIKNNKTYWVKDMLESDWLHLENQTAQIGEILERTTGEYAQKLQLRGGIQATDLVSHLQLTFQDSDLRQTDWRSLEMNGLGYNNLIYVSAMSLINRWRRKETTSYPFLVIEEPEAHLHPPMQRRLMEYLKDQLGEGDSFSKSDHSNLAEGETSAEDKSSARQVFVSSHSTHISAAAGLDSLIVLHRSTETSRVQAGYPGKVFREDDKDDEKSRRFVERFLDATKSNIFFSKRVIFVEGISELLLLPTFLKYCKGKQISFDERHVTVVAVGGENCRHFIKLFNTVREGHIDRKVACIVDGDPTRDGKKCFPFELAPREQKNNVSSTVTKLRDECSGSENILIFPNTCTFEYELALIPENRDYIITDDLSYKSELKEISNAIASDEELQWKDYFDRAKERHLPDKTKNSDELYAAFFVMCCKKKGSSTQHLLYILEEEFDKKSLGRFRVPDYIRKAINWVFPDEKPA